MEPLEKCRKRALDPKYCDDIETRKKSIPDRRLKTNLPVPSKTSAIQCRWKEIIRQHTHYSNVEGPLCVDCERDKRRQASEKPEQRDEVLRPREDVQRQLEKAQRQLEEAQQRKEKMHRQGEEAQPSQEERIRREILQQDEDERRGEAAKAIRGLEGTAVPPTS